MFLHSFLVDFQFICSSNSGEIPVRTDHGNHTQSLLILLCFYRILQGFLSFDFIEIKGFFWYNSKVCNYLLIEESKHG